MGDDEGSISDIKLTASQDIGLSKLFSFRQAVCQICLQRPFQYTCPRCEAVYCNLDCYKKHSTSCTEEFFHSQVVEALKANRPTEEEKKATEKKLAQFYRDWHSEADVLSSLYKLSEDQITSSDEDENDKTEKPVVPGRDLTPRVQELNDNGTQVEDAEDALISNDNDANLGGDSVCALEEERIEELKKLARDESLSASHLTTEELRMFHSALKRGLLDKYVKQTNWVPWWQKVAVVECPETMITGTMVTSLVENNRLSACYRSFREIAHTCCRSGSPQCLANPRVAYNVLDLLYAYCRIMRIYAGDTSEDLDNDAATQFLVLCPFLKKQKSYPPQSLLEAVDTILERVRQDNGAAKQSPEFDLLCYQDVCLLLSDKWKTLRALAEIDHLFKSTILALGQAAPDGKDLLIALKRARKKLAFCSSYCFWHLWNGKREDSQNTERQGVSSLLDLEHVVHAPAHNATSSTTRFYAPAAFDLSSSNMRAPSETDKLSFPAESLRTELTQIVRQRLVSTARQKHLKTLGFF